jgi:ATP-dependent protease ClpP protease subunit
MINELIPLTQPKRVLTRTFTNTEYKIRLARPITEIDDFEEEIMALESAQNGDIVFMQLSSPGGSLETCDFICRRMNECEAPIVVEIGLTCASAASAMCLQASDWIIHDSSTMMVHACSYSPGFGKEIDVFSSATYTNRVNREWVERTYRGFLTEKELQEVLDGKDLYFYADDLRERLPKYKQYREELEDGGCQCGNCNNDEEGMVNLDDIIEQKVKEILDKDKEVSETKPKRRSKPKVVKPEKENS